MGNPVIKTKITRPYQICKCCVMDTTDDDITFDANGVCMRCNEYKERIEPEWNHGKGHEKELQELVAAMALQEILGLASKNIGITGCKAL